MSIHKLTIVTIQLQGSPGKYILISPPGNGSGGHTGNGDTISCSAPTSGGHSMLKSPGHRRIREGKKCRKVYGLEQRDLWCTQCKWKKACARFAKPSSAGSAASGSLLTQAGSSHETSATSLLIPAGAGNGIGAPGGTASNAVRAIKFWSIYHVLISLEHLLSFYHTILWSYDWETKHFNLLIVRQAIT